MGGVGIPNPSIPTHLGSQCHECASVGGGDAEPVAPLCEAELG